MTYNGWKNYETWCVHLHITNDEGSYRYWAHQAREEWCEAPENDNVEQNIWTLSECARFRLSDQLKDEHEEAMHRWFDSVPNQQGEPTLLHLDMLQSAFAEVEWHEIADALLADCEGYEPAAFVWKEA